jgi:arylsulfatase A-like enzyme
MRYFLAALLVFVCGWNASAAEPRKPNIVFILADDLGYTDVACFGSKYYETPNIDQLAADGVRFTNAYSCGPNCQPTRAALMSGQYGPRTGVYTVGSIDRFDWPSRPLKPVENVTSLPLEKITIADSLKKAGYATGMFGKWHLGSDPQHHPGRRGFDEAIESAGVHFDFKTNPPTNYPKGQYLADFLTEHAVEFIERHREEPFFLYLPHYAVHAPHQAKEDWIAHFKKKSPVGGHKNPAYAGMIASVDESVGRIRDTLDKLGLLENTLIIFSSDNGGVGGYESAGVHVKGVTDNAPLKGGKGTLYEGGVRIPYVAYWKGKTPTGTKNTTPINSVDLYPTLLEIAGAERPHGYTLDGVSYAPLLTGEKKTLDREAIFWHFPGYLGAAGGEWRTTPGAAVRAGDWKLIEYFEDGRQELYNLQDDIGEKHNLATANPEKVKELHGKLAAWQQSVGAKMPTKNLDVKPPGKSGGKRGQRKKERKNRGAARDE